MVKKTKTLSVDMQNLTAKKSPATSSLRLSNKGNTCGVHSHSICKQVCKRRRKSTDEFDLKRKRTIEVVGCESKVQVLCVLLK